MHPAHLNNPSEPPRRLATPGGHGRNGIAPVAGLIVGVFASGASGQDPVAPA